MHAPRDSSGAFPLQLVYDGCLRSPSTCRTPQILPAALFTHPVRTDQIGPERDFKLMAAAQATVSKGARMPTDQEKQTSRDQHNAYKETSHASRREEDGDARGA